MAPSYTFDLLPVFAAKRHGVPAASVRSAAVATESLGAFYRSRLLTRSTRGFQKGNSSAIVSSRYASSKSPAEVARTTATHGAAGGRVQLPVTARSPLNPASQAIDIGPLDEHDRRVVGAVNFFHRSMKSR
jgi:hypothetical protein